MFNQAAESLVLLLGWPTLTIASVLLLYAAVRGSRLAAILGCILLVPLAFYLAATPRFRWAGPALLVSLALVAWHVTKARHLLRLALALPAAGFLVLLVYSLITRRLWHVV